MIIVTTETVPGMEIRDVKGLVNTVSVQSHKKVAGITLQNNSSCRRPVLEAGLLNSQQDAINKLIAIAESYGANAIIGFKLESSRVGNIGTTTAYGTAVIVSK